MKSEHLTINNTSIASDTEIQTVENPVAEDNTSINETIKDIFMQNITTDSMNFNERNYNTRVNKIPSPDILKTIDDVALQYLLKVQAREKWPPSLIDLNNYIYSAAVSENHYLVQLIEHKDGNNKKQTELSRWLAYLQDSINRTRRDIAHIMTITERRMKKSVY